MNVITVKNSEEYSKALKILREQGVDFETKTSFEQLLEDESKFRLDSYKEDYHLSFPEALEDEILERVEVAFDNNNILDYDLMDQLLRDVVQKVLEEEGLEEETFIMNERNILELVARQADYHLEVHEDGSVSMKHFIDSNNAYFYPTIKDAIADWYDIMLVWNEEFGDGHDELRYIRREIFTHGDYDKKLAPKDAEKYFVSARYSLIKELESLGKPTSITHLSKKITVLPRDVSYVYRIKEAILSREDVVSCSLGKEDLNFYFELTFA